jgi:hypothetical protein
MRALRQTKTWAWLGGVALLALACSSGTGGGGGDVTGQPCPSLGQSTACNCDVTHSGIRVCGEDGWESCDCANPNNGICTDEGQIFDCSCGPGQSGIAACDVNLELSACSCNSTGVCSEGAVSTNCQQECEGPGKRECVDGSWTSCTCDTSACPEGETKACQCEDSSSGTQLCTEGSWGSCEGCGGGGGSGGTGGGGGSGGTGGGGGCAPPLICQTYANVMNGCFNTSVDWVSECMDHFDICDGGGDGCGAPTPNEITCVIKNGCDYAAAGCLKNTCY